MNSICGVLLRALVVVVAVSACIAGSTKNALAADAVKIGVLPFGSGGGTGMKMRLMREQGPIKVKFLVPDGGGDVLSAEEVLGQLSDYVAIAATGGNYAGGVGGLNVGLMAAIVPKMHGFPEGLEYELKAQDPQWAASGKESQLMSSNFGAVPVSTWALGESAAGMGWETKQVVALFRQGVKLVPGAKFRLTELPIDEEVKAFLEAGGFEVPAQEPPDPADTTGKTEVFSKAVEMCIVESQKYSKPMVECYNLYAGRARETKKWLQESYKAVEQDRYDYGPYVTPPMERLDRRRLK